MTRLRKRSGGDYTNTNMVKVQFNSVEIKTQVLRNGRKLKSSLPSVYVNPDLTDCQRIEFKKARESAKQLNNDLENTDQQGNKFGTENGRQFYYGVRNLFVRKIFRQSSVQTSTEL
jgi:hypothetical protein